MRYQTLLATALLTQSLLHTAAAGADWLAEFSPPSPVSDRRFDAGSWEPFAYGTDYDRRAFRFTHDGRYILSPNEANWRMQIRDVRDGAHVADFGAAHEGFHSLAVSPDGRRVVIMHYSHVELYDLEGRRYIRSLDEGVAPAGFQGVAFLDPRQLALVSRGALCIWDVETSEELARFDLNRQDKRVQLNHVAGAAGGAAVAVMIDNRVALVEAATGNLRATLGRLPQETMYRRHLHAPTSMAMSADGRLLALGCADAIRLYDITAGEELPPLTAHRGGVWCLQFLPDGEALLSLGKDNRLLSWRVAEIAKPWQYRGPPLTPEMVAEAVDRMDLDDAWTSYVATRVAMRSPTDAVAHLRKKIQPVTKLDADRLNELVAQITDKDLNTRKRAVRSMGSAIDQVFAALPERHEVQQAWQWRLPTEAQVREVQFVWLLHDLNHPEAVAFLKELAGGYEKSPITMAAKEALASGRPELPADLSWEQACEILAQADASKALAVMRRLLAQKDAIRGKLIARLEAIDAQPGFGDDAATARDWIRQLDSDDFDAREKAVERLVRLGKPIEPQLRTALAGSPGPEVKLRLEGILKKLEHRGLSDQELLARRLMETAVLSGDPALRIHLSEMGQKAKSPWMRQQATTLMGE